MRRLAIFLLGPLLIITIPASATIINVPDDYPTIQQGIDASADGDTVLVQPGPYVEHINFNGHNIVLGSLLLTTGDTSYVSTTIIDGDYSYQSVVTFESGEDSTTFIVGFTIQHGSFFHGGGIHCSENSQPNIWRNLIKNNRAYASSGKTYGGGIYCAGNSNPRIIENTIKENNAWSDQEFPFVLDGDGAGIYCKESSMLIKGNLIEDNVAGYISYPPHLGKGGGACIDSNSYAQIIDNEFRGNVALGGPAIWSVYSSTVISNNIIENNYEDMGDGGAAVNCVDTRSLIAFNIINDNQIGIECRRDSSLIIGNLIINEGSGINLNDSFVTLMNNTICRNGWCGIYSVGSIGTIINSIFRDNIAYPIIIQDSRIDVTYCDVDGGWTGEGNIDTDPIFRDPDNNDYHLMSAACGDPFDSPCIDAGDPAIIDSLLDCDWGLGSELSDMGAYGGADSVEVKIQDNIGQLPEEISIAQNYPNPFNASTIIEYALPEAADVTVEIYDILGRRVESLAQGRQDAGRHQVAWKAADAASGVYIYRIQCGNYVFTRKMILIK